MFMCARRLRLPGTITTFSRRSNETHPVGRIEQEEARACEIEGREMRPAAKRELRLCEVMCR